jgi:hypothetical protein
MSNQIPALTDKQLRTYEGLQRIRMAWVALVVILGAFIADLAALIYAAFSPTVGAWTTGAFAATDGLLGFSLHQVVRCLFPAPWAADSKPVKPKK